jgi:hypothetical protein
VFRGAFGAEEILELGLRPEQFMAKPFEGLVERVLVGDEEAFTAAVYAGGWEEHAFGSMLGNEVEFDEWATWNGQMADAYLAPDMRRLSLIEPSDDLDWSKWG